MASAWRSAPPPALLRTARDRPRARRSLPRFRRLASVAHASWMWASRAARHYALVTLRSIRSSVALRCGNPLFADLQGDVSPHRIEVVAVVVESDDHGTCQVLRKRGISVEKVLHGQSRSQSGEESTRRSLVAQLHVERRPRSGDR